MQALDAHDLVERTSNPAFATDGARRIVAWNRPAERLLGLKRSQALGRRCYRLIRGTDVFGNRFCDRTCPLLNMARRREPVHPFELVVPTSAGDSVPVAVVASFLTCGARAGLCIAHLLHPLDHATGTAFSPVEKLVRLTPRQAEILQLLAQGRTTQEIADLLVVKVATVRNHTQAILHKLHAHTRLEAIAISRREGLL
jgi:DNA-binding CsgD family transcriptional regulator